MPHPQKEHHGINMGWFQDDFVEQYQDVECGHIWWNLITKYVGKYQGNALVN